MCDPHAAGAECRCSSPACPCCGQAFDLQQPDTRHPELLLGVCGECMLWALIDGRDAAVIELIAVRLSREPSPPPTGPTRPGPGGRGDGSAESAFIRVL